MDTWRVNLPWQLRKSRRLTQIRQIATSEQNLRLPKTGRLFPIPLALPDPSLRFLFLFKLILSNSLNTSQVVFVLKPVEGSLPWLTALFLA